MKKLSNHIWVLLFFLISSSAVAKSDNLDKELNKILNEINASIQKNEDQQSTNCAHFEELDEAHKEENDNALVLKESLVVTGFKKSIELNSGDRVFYSNSSLKRKTDKVRIKYDNGSKKGSGYISSKSLKTLLETNSITPISCQQ